MFNAESTERLIHWFVSAKKGNVLDKLALLKLIFFADRYHLRKYARTITGDTYYARPHGPVANNTYDLISKIGNKQVSDWAKKRLFMKTPDKISAKLKPSKDDFSESEMEAIKFVESNFLNLSMKKLEDISHEYPEWKQFEDLILSKATKSVEINIADMLNDSEKSKEKYPALPPKEFDAKKRWCECGLI